MAPTGPSLRQRPPRGAFLKPPALRAVDYSVLPVNKGLMALPSKALPGYADGVLEAREACEMSVLRAIVVLVRGIVVDRGALAAENLALRQQLAALQQRSKRPRLRKRDRIFWALLSRVWPNWRSALLIVQPDTVIR